MTRKICLIVYGESGVEPQIARYEISDQPAAEPSDHIEAPVANEPVPTGSQGAATNLFEGLQPANPRGHQASFAEGSDAYAPTVTDPLLTPGAADPSTSLSDAIGHQPSAMRDLTLRLGELGFDFPIGHLRTFLDWSHAQNLQLGIRTPHPEDLARLADHAANPRPNAHTLTWHRLCDEVIKLTQLFAFDRTRTEEKSEDLALQITATFGPHSGAAALDPPATGQDVKAHLDVALNSLFMLICNILPFPDQPETNWQTHLTSVRAAVESGQTHLARELLNAFRTRAETEAETAGNPKQLTGLAGLACGWNRIDLSDAMKGVRHSVLIPVGIMLAGGAVAEIDWVAEGVDLNAIDQSNALTEGYRLFRIHSKLPEDASAKATAHIRQIQQLHRDEITLRAALHGDEAYRKAPVKPSQADGEVQVPAQLIAPVNPHDSDFIFSGNGVLPGGLVIAAPNSGETVIHVFNKSHQLSDGVRDQLTDAQDKNRRRNDAALVGLMFLVGQFYQTPGRGFGEKFDKAFQAGLRKKVALLGLGVTVVFFTAFTVGAPVVVALVASGMVGVKHLISRKNIRNPKKILKDKDLLTMRVSELTDESDSNEELAALAAKNALKFGDYVADERYSSLLTKTQKEARASVEKYTKNAALEDQAVGDLLRRSFVHFRMAKEKMEKNAHEKNPAVKKTREGKILHHLEKGWRYMGPSLVFFDLVWAMQVNQKKAWAEFSPRAAHILLKQYQETYDEVEELQNAEGAKKFMKERLGPCLGLRTISKHARRAWRATAKKLDEKGLVYDKPTPKKQFESQLDIFGKLGYRDEGQATDPDTWGRWGDRAAEIGGPELFSEWQCRGGMLEPFTYKPQSSTQSHSSSGRDRDAYDLVHRLKSAGYLRLNIIVANRMMLYHWVASQTREATEAPAAQPIHQPDTGNRVRKIIRTPGLVLKSLWRWARNEPFHADNTDISEDKSELARALIARVKGDENLQRGWIKADHVPRFTKRAKHDWRNLWMKSTKSEKVIDAGLTLSEMTVGFWGQMGFGTLDDMLKIPLSKDKSGIFDEKLTMDLVGDKLWEATKKGLISGGLAAGKTGVDLSANSALGARRKVVAEHNYLISQTARGSFAARNLVQRAARARVVATDAKKKAKTRAKNQDDAIAELKSMAAYVGSNLMADIGLNMMKVSQSQIEFAAMNQRQFEEDPDKVGKLTNIWRKLKPGDKFDTILLQIKPLAETYAYMDELDTQLNDLLMYLEMMTNLGRTLESQLFQDMAFGDQLVAYLQAEDTVINTNISELGASQ